VDERLVSVPGYPFARDAFWVAFEKPSTSETPVSVGLYAPAWVERTLTAEPEARAPEGVVGPKMA